MYFKEKYYSIEKIKINVKRSISNREYELPVLSASNIAALTDWTGSSETVQQHGNFWNNL